MKALRLHRNKTLHLMVAFSMLVGMLVIPSMPAKAGFLGSFLAKTRPILNVVGKVGGAIAGASLCGAFVPPLGMIAGGILGWIAGGIITGYATGSLTNLATLGGAAAGAAALGSFGPMGMIGGVFLGGFLGRMLMNVLYKADNATTGGMVFAKTNNSLSTWFTNLKNKFKATTTKALGSVGLSTSGFSSSSFSGGVVGGGAPSAGIRMDMAPVGNTNPQLMAAQEKYQKAYQTYADAQQTGDNAKAAEAHKAYLSAYQEYQSLGGK